MNAHAADGADPDARTRMPRSANEVNALIHLYRAEMGRLTSYRARLDTTTSWAITSTALVTTFALGNHEIPHLAFLFLLFINFFFLQLEARRFRAYEASRHRVQFLESTFYPEMLGGAAPPDWPAQLVRSLQRPNLTVNRLGALAWRLRRNYGWIYGAVLLTWVGKLSIEAGSAWDPSALVAEAAVGALPGWLVVAAVLLFYGGLLAVAVGARRIYPQGADEVWDRMQEAPAGPE